MRLRDKVAVITGAASGMGKATALRFLAEGASVVLADYNTETGAAALSEAADQGFGERSRFVRADVAVEADVENMLDSAVQTFGHLDIVFNNAGVGGAIINTSSIAGLSGDAGPVAYSAAKAAVINLTRAAAVELAPERIRVNAICPGFIATPLAEQGRPGATRREFAKS